MQDREPEWMTTAAAAEYLKVHPETIRKWARRGALPGTKLGNRGGFRFRRDELDRFMELRREVEPMRLQYFALGRGVYHRSEKCAGPGALPTSTALDPAQYDLIPCGRCIR